MTISDCAAWLGLALALCALLLALPRAQARTIEEAVEVTVTVKNMYGKESTQPIKVTVFRDTARKRSPFLVLNHGRAVDPVDFVKLGRVKYSANSKYFVAKGFAVFVPTRVGYGVSGGDDVEYSGACQTKNYPPAYEAAAQQTLKVIEYARGLPYVDPQRGIVVGQSFGGTTSIAVAAKAAPGVIAAVNFAGGGGGNPDTRPQDPCRADLIERLFEGYGGAARLPTLWLYSENDKFFGIVKPREWFDAFAKRGGVGEFVRLPPFGENGHNSFTGNPKAWRPKFEEFLRRQGFSVQGGDAAETAGPQDPGEGAEEGK